MADIGVSESTFQFAFLHEWLNEHRGFAMRCPLLPSTNQEARLGGFDAHVPLRGIDYYFQFKKSDFMSGVRSRYYPLYRCRYYAFELRMKGGFKQHNDLCSLANDYLNTVFYVAPQFENESQFNTHFACNRIVENSKFVPLRQCREYRGYDVNLNHFISYLQQSNAFIQHSEASEGESYNGRQIIDEIKHRLSARNPEEYLSEEYFAKLMSSLRQRYGELSGEIETHKGSILESFAKYMFLKFGLLLVIFEPVG